jgi:cell division protein FtsA
LSGKTKLAVGLDLGSSSSRVVICALEDFTTRFLGYGEAPVQAWNKGRLGDLEALSASIRSALEEAEKRAQASPESALIGLGGCVSGMNSRGVYEFGRRRRAIEPEDLTCAVELAARVQLDEDREILQICPQDFTLDGRAGYRNPKGIMGARLEANVLVVTVSLHEHQAIVSAVHGAHLAVEESVFEAIAAGYAAVLPEDRARGAAIVDMGAQSTELAIYDGDSLLLATSIPIGGDHFTRDLARLFKVNYDFAEALKRQFGSAVTESVPETALVELPSGDGRGVREASRRQLNEILEARAEQIFEHVYNEVLRVGMEEALLEGVVLTGGGALLPEICDVAERIMHCPARKGLALGIEGWPSELDNPAWTTAGGLAMYSGRLKLKRDWKRASTSIAGSAVK